MSMSKSSFSGTQKSGYLYKRGASSWQQRLVHFSNDTGTMKFYAEKSGKKTAKGQVNLKQAAYGELDPEQVGKPYAFMLEINAPNVKEDEKHQVLAAIDQDQFELWTSSIKEFVTSNGGRLLGSASQENHEIDDAVVPEAVEQEQQQPSDMNQQHSKDVLVSAVAPTSRVESPSDSQLQIREEISVQLRNAEAYAEEEDMNDSDRRPHPQQSEQNNSYNSLESALAGANNHSPSVSSTAADALTPLSNYETMESHEIVKPVADKKLVSHMLTMDEDGVAAMKKAAAQGKERKESSPTPPAPDGLPPRPKQQGSAAANLFSSISGDDDGDNNPAHADLQQDEDDEDGHSLNNLTTVAHGEENPNLQRLNAKLLNSRKSFEKPQFKNLLNSNGLDSASNSPITTPSMKSRKSSTKSPTGSDAAGEIIKKKFSKKSKGATQGSKEGESGPPSSTGKKMKRKSTLSRSSTPSGEKTPKRIIKRELNISERPTEPTRMGYLYKLDTSSKDVGEDSWMSQYVTLDVRTSILQHYAEIGGRRILRGEFNLQQCTVKTIETICNGKFWTFKVSYRPPSGAGETPGDAATAGTSAKEKKVSATFAADDEETLNYWLISVEDCDKHSEQQKAEEARLKEAAAMLEMEEKQGIAETAADVTQKQGPTASSGSFDDHSAIERPQKSGSLSYKPFEFSESTANLLDVKPPQIPSPPKEDVLKAAKSLSRQRSFHFPKEASNRTTPVDDPSRRSTPAEDPNLANTERLTANPEPVTNSELDIALRRTGSDFDMNELYEDRASSIPEIVPAGSMEINPLRSSISKNVSGEMSQISSLESTDYEGVYNVSITESGVDIEDKLFMNTSVETSRGLNSSMDLNNSSNRSFDKAIFNHNNLGQSGSNPLARVRSPAVNSIARKNSSTLQIQNPNSDQDLLALNNALTAGSSPETRTPLTKVDETDAVKSFDGSELDDHLGVTSESPMKINAGMLAAALARRSGGVSETETPSTGVSGPSTRPAPFSPAAAMDTSTPHADVEVSIPPSIVFSKAGIESANPIDVEVSDIQLNVQSVKYPAERLARRIKIWYCSSGFSLSSETEIEQFVRELKNTGDSVLESFAEEKFGNILDWAHLLEVLRKYEQRKLVEEPGKESNATNSNIVFSIDANLPSRKLPAVQVELDDAVDISSLAKKLAEPLGASENVLAALLPETMTGEGKAFNVGLNLLKDDLTFAEDLLLYQEEVIDHLWDSYSTLKTLLEQKDEVINQLYTQISDMQESSALSSNGTIVMPVKIPAATVRVRNTPSKSTKEAKAEKEEAAAKKEEKEKEKSSSLKAAEEEIQNLIEEKKALIKSHNDAKTSWLKDMATLKKFLSPNAEEALKEARKQEQHQAKLEAELVNANIRMDTMKMEMQMLREKLQETEVEKSLMQSEYEERIAKQQKEFQQQLAKIQSGEAKPTDFSPAKHQSRKDSSLSFMLPSEQRAVQEEHGLASSQGVRGRYDSDLAYSNELKHEDLHDLDEASRDWLQRHMNGLGTEPLPSNVSQEELLSPSERHADNHRNDMFRMVHDKPQDHSPQPKQSIRRVNSGHGEQQKEHPAYSNTIRNSNLARNAGAPRSNASNMQSQQRLYGVYPNTPYAAGPPLVNNAVLNEVGVDALLYPHDHQIHRSMQPQMHPLRNALRSDIARKNTTKGQAPPPYATRGRSPPRSGGGALNTSRSGTSPSRHQQQQTGYTNPHLRQMQQALNNSADFDPLTYGQPQKQSYGNATNYSTPASGKHGAQRFMTNTASRTGKLMEKDKPRLPTDFLGSQRTTGNWKWA